MAYRYFAYGSALHAAHLAEWTHEHGYDGFTLEDGDAAVLDDWELTLSVPSRYWLGAVGTIAPVAGARVHGLLFTLADSAGDIVRHKEGVGSGLYREIDVEVRLAAPPGEDGDATLQLLPARAFCAAEGRSLAEPPPASRRWLDIVVAGGRARGLSDLWLADLERKGRRS